MLHGLLLILVLHLENVLQAWYLVLQQGSHIQLENCTIDFDSPTCLSNVGTSSIQADSV